MRTPTRWFWLAVGLVSCGPKQEAEDYLVEFTDLYCDVWLSCEDPAELAFDGIDGPEACVAEHGPRFDAKWSGCVLDQGDAKKCLAFLPATGCPEAGGDLDANLPPECETAWKKCIGGTPGETE